MTRLWLMPVVCLEELQSGRQRTVAADEDQAVDAQPGKNLAGVLHGLGRDADLVARADLADEMALVGSAEDRAALRHDERGRMAVEDPVVARLQEAFEAVDEPDDFPVEFVGGAHDAADDGVEAGAVTAAGEDADAFLGHKTERMKDAG